jgi:hypothetical protein
MQQGTSASNRHRLEMLRKTELSESDAASSADAIFADPERYGF